jgi:hypothetical protein
MVDYKGFIEYYFRIKNKQGQIAPFKFNPIQRLYYEQLMKDYPRGMIGVKENILKARKEGMSSFWEAIFTVDFILGTVGKGPIISSQVVSHKAEETKPHFQRVNLFFDSYLEKKKVDRKLILETDNQTSYLKSVRGLEIFVGTAGAKILGRGGDLHNLLWTEIAFYPNTPIINAEELVTGAEREVPPDQGKIIRESTGNVVGDYFHDEWYRGIGEYGSGESNFRSRFFPWFGFPEYVKPCPPAYKQFLPDEIELRKRFSLNSDQLYWYHTQRKDVKDINKFRREFPSEPMDAFLAGGSCFFDVPTLRWFLTKTKSPIQEGYLAPDGAFL